MPKILNCPLGWVIYTQQFYARVGPSPHFYFVLLYLWHRWLPYLQHAPLCPSYKVCTLGLCCILVVVLHMLCAYWGIASGTKTQAGDITSKFFYKRHCWGMVAAAAHLPKSFTLLSSSNIWPIENLQGISKTIDSVSVIASGAAKCTYLI